jgi:ribosome-binding protein aMBF1 (putative translation factor)
MKLHYIYKITNTADGRIYIGQTADPEYRWAQHRYLGNNPRPPPTEETRKKLSLSHMGQSRPCAPETRAKMSAAHTGRVNDSLRKLTHEQVRAIRSEYTKSAISQRKLAQQYGVACTTVACIITGKQYKDVI